MINYILYRNIILLITLFILSFHITGCKDKNNNALSMKDEDPKTYESLRKDLKAMNFTRNCDSLSNFINNSGEKKNSISLNLEWSQLYTNNFPRENCIAKAPTFWEDQAATRFLQFRETYFAAKLNSGFKPNLPISIKNKINETNLYKKDLVDIFLIVQDNRNSNIYENEVDQNNIPIKTIHLRVHPWADPSAPANFTGTRFNKNIPMGVFESDIPNVSFSLAEKSLRPSSVNVHDRTCSYRGDSKIKLPPGETHYAWTLAVDDNNYDPNLRKKAVATLTLFLGDANYHQFLDILNRNNVNNLDNFIQELEKAPKLSAFEEINNLVKK